MAGASPLTTPVRVGDKPPPPRRAPAAVGRAATLAAAVLVAGRAAHGVAPDPSQLVGTWVFTDGSTAVECPATGPLSTPLQGQGTRASIYPGTNSDLVFDLGCHCQIAVNLTATGAEIAGAQRCVIVNQGVQLSGQVDTLTLGLTDAGRLTFTLAGSNATFTIRTATCPNLSFSGSGTLEHVDTAFATCGDEATAVGVLTYAPTGNGACTWGAGREGLQIQMQDEETDPCSDETGSSGEGPWVLPDDGRPRAPNCALHRSRTVLNFCRVDGARFRPMSTADDPAQFFAVLKLGTSCPASAVEVGRTIDNEDTPAGAANAVIGDPKPNIVVVDPTVGSLTTLSFCYFRAAASSDGTMTAFPDLGFPYAVFHSYLSEQPPWVITKRWQYSKDETGPNSKDVYLGDAALIEEFRNVVEGGVERPYDTYFDLARVR